jgi:hypothetical protein
MTKKHFEYAAQAVQLYQTEADRDILVNFLVQLFARFAPSFDNGRFRRACVPGANVRARS